VLDGTGNGTGNGTGKCNAIGMVPQEQGGKAQAVAPAGSTVIGTVRQYMSLEYQAQ